MEEVVLEDLKKRLAEIRLTAFELLPYLEPEYQERIRDIIRIATLKEGAPKNNFGKLVE
ncbi:MAG TPA: hypothetical protein VK190_02785 [Pseudoneobacillus sp.]|nr:hypothetical protein [Pseudoneobacillus sp.]